MDKITAADKKISLFDGGFHELQNEPDGVKEKLADEVVQFIEDRLPPTISVTEAEPLHPESSSEGDTSADPQAKL